MSDIVIRVENLYKEYRLGTISHGTLRQDLQSWWARIRGNEDPNSIISTMQPSTGKLTSRPSRDNPHFLALSDVSFDVKRGEILGIIGRNGAGKSTLLKILSEVTSPSKGSVKIKGRVASLLEVGTGFHPELTGRENVFLNGAILGMTKKEIDSKFDEIVAFAELEKFLDTPVKRYSSGMYVRLAFAVAAHLDPDILIVDEVLAVGDINFQQKCGNKMGNIAREGRTVLVVSHNMRVVEALTENCMYLKNGCISGIGPTLDIIKQYQRESSDQSFDYNLPSEFDMEIRNPKIAIYSLIITDDKSEKTRVFEPGQAMNLSLDLEASEDYDEVVICLRIYRDGIILSGNNSNHTLGQKITFKNRDRKKIQINIEELMLLPGNYIAVAFILPSYFSPLGNAISNFFKQNFIVQGSREHGGGYVFLRQKWSMENFQ